MRIFLFALLLPFSVLGQGYSGFSYSSDADDFKLRFHGLLQTRLDANLPTEGTWSYATVNPRFALQRTRLGLDGYVKNDRFEYSLLFGLVNEVESPKISQVGVLDAYLRFRVMEGFKIQFGQFLLPGSRQGMTLVENMELSSRSIAQQAYGLYRDRGIMIKNEFHLGTAVVKDYLALTMGEGLDNAVLGGLNYTARLELMPLGDFENDGGAFEGDLSREESMKMQLGVSYDYNDNAQREKGQNGNYTTAERDIQTLTADLFLKWKGFSITAEWYDRHAPIPVVYVPSAEGIVTAGVYEVGQGFNGQLGYLLNSDIQFVFRYSNVNALPVTEFQYRDVQQYTLGLTKYFALHRLKVQGEVQYMPSSVAGLGDELFSRLQLTVGF